MAGVDKPKPLKVFGRSHYACTRCKLSKIRCSGEKPACANCKSVNKGDACVYPNRDRKIVIMESDLNKLHERVSYLESLVKNQAGPEVAPVDVGPDLDLIPPTLPPADLASASVKAVGRLGVIGFEESYLLSDYENDLLLYRLISMCGHKLPDQHYTIKLITKVYNTYSSEFFLLEWADVSALVDSVYLILSSNSNDRDWIKLMANRIPSISLCYLLIIIAFGEQLYNVSTTAPTTPSLPAEKEKQKIPGIDYYLLATQLFHLTQEELTNQFIQSALLLALYSANLNRYNTVYNYFGVAVRSAVASGYHRQRTDPLLDLDAAVAAHRIANEKAKRLWWTIFVIDTTWAAKMNMPVHIEYTDTDVDLPVENGVVDLGDNFDSEILEVNVHLTKFIAKFIKLLYGPNIRSFSVNYINTDQFNQKLLIKNTIQCLDDLINIFEGPFLTPYKSLNVIQPNKRNIGNLFLRFHQLVILITKPMLLLLFTSPPTDLQGVEQALTRGLLAALATIDIILTFYRHDKLFVLGFWDSQHLFSAILLTVVICLNNPPHQVHAGIALLSYMAANENINAQNCMKKLGLVNDVLQSIPELGTYLDLNADISLYVLKDPAHQPAFFNPFLDEANTRLRVEQILASTSRVASFSTHSQALVHSLIQTAQSWDNFRGLPIHIYGTRRVPELHSQ